MNKENYRYKLEHEFGLDTEGILREDLRSYSDKVSNMAVKYNTSKFYIRRKIRYLAFRRLREKGESNLEHSVNIVERWLKIGGGR